ncbi:uncharacterized protein LOC103313769 [Tribolium castaneum]|uniref:Uncharacterized protein n=1 Tax=Tribolium castaneum TaxID=7070 RepID=A0A139WDQ1_TRICA|nr:hypothetical protein TcasGA2_TC033948 [Tribolium castaneum]
MKIWLSFVLLGVCTTALPFPQKNGDALGPKDSKLQIGAEQYKKLLGHMKDFVSSLQNLPKIELDDLSDIDKLEKTLENKDIKRITELLRNFILGVQKLRAHAEGASDAKPAANAKAAADAKPAEVPK